MSSIKYILAIICCASLVTAVNANENIQVKQSTAELKSITGVETWQQLWAKYFGNNASNQQNAYEETDTIYRITVSSENAFIYFTKETHPAHPSFARIAIEAVDGRMKLRTFGYTWGDDAKYQQFMQKEVLPFAKEMALGLVEQAPEEPQDEEQTN